MPQKPFKLCILHIGTEKTGSTAIQHYLKSNRKRLSKKGVLFPNAADPTHTSQWEFVAVSHHQPWTQDVGKAFEIKNAQHQSKFRSELEAKLESEFQAASNCETLLISSEHFQSRLYLEDDILALKHFLQRWVEKFKIVVYFRRQDELALSLLSTRIKSSAPIDVENILKTLKMSPRYYAYDDIFERWANTFGSESMVARRYDSAHWPQGDLIADFCHASEIPEFSHPDARYNLSLNRKGFHFIHALNRLYADRTDPLAEKERLRIVRLISEKYSGKYFPISRAEAEEFFRGFEKTNNRLRALAFPELSGPLFSDDFSAYPTHAEPSDSSFGEAVEVGMSLWEETLQKPPRPSWRNLRDRILRR